MKAISRTSFRVLAGAVAFALLFTASRAGAQAARAGEPAPAYDLASAKNVMMPMRDGVRLATDIYFPARNGAVASGKFPVLLSRTPYGKNGSAAAGEFLARRGYIVAVQDVRGRYESEGTFYIYLSEGKDGYDAVEWLAKQPWSNGDVGTFGGSYLAATQNALAVEHPPHLKAMFVVVGTANYHEDGAGGGGASYILHNVAYAFSLASVGKEAMADPPRGVALADGTKPDGLGQWLRAFPYRKSASPFAIAPSYDKWFQDWMDHPDYDDYWKQNGFTFELYYDRYPDIPVYFVGGWYDIFLRGTLRNYAGLASRQSAPKKLLIGPWVHGVGTRGSGDLDFGPTAAMSMQLEQLRWFDQVLRGQKTGVLDEPPVKLFVMGGGSGRKTVDGRLDHGGQWVPVSAWPTPGASPRQFYLHADGTLSEQQPAAASPPSVFTFDPTKPVPTIGGRIDSGKQLASQGPYDQRCVRGKVFGCEDDLPLSARPDVLVFQTGPLAEDVVINGPLTVKLWVSSSALDTDFTAKLVDVYPPSADYPRGYDLLLADRIVRARYRNSVEKPELLKPGETTEVTIDLLGVANRFQRGHRIRVDISSSNFPFYDVNPNTGEPLGHHTRLVAAVNTVYHDAGHPSHIVLPIMPATPRAASPR